MIKYSKILSLALLAMVLSSCLKDDMIDDQKYGMINLNANKIVELPTGTEKASLLLEDKETTLDFVTINLAADQVAQEDLHITLDTAGTADLVKAYNQDNTDSLTKFPDGLYEYPDGQVITIPKGSRTGILKIKLNQLNLNPATAYGMAFHIVNVDKTGYIISGNFNSTLSMISAKNQYDGIYSYSGTLIRNTAAGPDNALGGPLEGLDPIPLVTLSQNSLAIEPLWADGSTVGGIAGTSITVDPVTNLVTVSSTGNPLLKNTPGGVNKYDPATKTFTLSFDWGVAPATRIATITMTYVEPRP